MAIQAQLYPNNLGCGTVGFAQSCFNSQHKHHQELHQLEQGLRQLNNERQRNQNMFIDVNGTTNNYHPPSMSISQSLALHFEKQRQDIDRYIRLQNDKLRIMLQEQRKQLVATLLKKVESDTLYLLRQKDEEIAQAANKKMELEEILRRLEEENQTWRRVAQENEATVVSLHNTLEKMKERARASYCEEDAESCCNEGRGNNTETKEEEETGENIVGFCGVGEVEQITRKLMVCKGCNSRSSCFLFLPCRHLCSCKACEPLLQACPVCTMPKKASIEALIF